MPKIQGILVLGAMAFLLAGCGEDTPGNPDSGSCETDDECQEGYRCSDGVCVESPPCTDLDQDGFCDDNQDCEICTDCNDNRPDINPDVAEDGCDQLDNDCDDLTDENCPCQTGEARPCGQSVGACRKGQVYCENGVWGECTGNIDPQDSEDCSDNLDNDCNGAINDGCPCTQGSSQACWSILGECTPGIQTCIQEGGQWIWGPCTGGTPPEDESCDDELDNDCDGAINNGCFCDTEQWRYCGLNVGVCHAGKQNCNMGVWGNCEGGHWPELEVCDGLDNDCDGTTDQGCDCLDYTFEECGSNVGECKKGTRICVEGQWTPCANDIGPSDEICDGRDNDCDTEYDEEFPDLGNTCEVGTGLCMRPGVMVCRSDHTGSVCSATPGQGTSEICDQKDNDCDGLTDEDFTQLGEACSIGTGICESSGVWICFGGGVACDATPIVPQEELCDGLDNDCNGMTDERFYRLGLPCTIGLGECQVSGTYICTTDQSTTECDATPPNGVPEECDGLDNDCDGLTDEGQDDDPYTWVKDCSTDCGDGFIFCQGGQETVCSARQPDPDDSVCNGFNDDCDELTDEDVECKNVDDEPGIECLGDPCTVGQGICLASGFTVCDGAGSIRCNAEAGTPQYEGIHESSPNPWVCQDGADNDCDGIIDLDDGCQCTSTSECGTNWDWTCSGGYCQP